jgi:hypothetical protein
MEIMTSEIEFEYSIKGSANFGISHKRRVTIYLDKIAEMYDPEKYIKNFIIKMCAVEIHEVGHIFGEYRCGNYYRALTDIIGSYLRDRKWYKKYSKHLKEIVNELDIAKKKAIANNDHICRYCIKDDACDISLIYEIEFHTFVRDCKDFEAIQNRVHLMNMINSSYPNGI